MMKIAVLDIETTGLNPERNRILEIGILFLEDFEVTDHYQELIDPEVNIPSVITNLTGISIDDLHDSPTFDEIAETILCLLEGYVICGHNVSFDYAFLKMEFQRCGFNFTKELLDTAAVSKYLFPGRNSYSLASLCHKFGVVNDRPHRAYPDAKATTDALLNMRKFTGKVLFNKIIDKELSGRTAIKIPKKLIDELPQDSGVYYFLNSLNKPVYIGKAKNIKARIHSHLRGDGNSFKIIAAANKIVNLKYTTTGSELLALLLEDHEIRHFWPVLNNSQKNYNKRFGVAVFKDQQDRWRMAVCNAGKTHCFVSYFHQYHKAIDFVLDKIKTYGLNGTYCNQQIQTDVDDQEHNRAFESMLQHLNESVTVEVFLTDGRREGELGFIWVENNRYRGFGFACKEDIKDLEKLRKLLQVRYSSITIEKTIQNLKKNNKPDLVFHQKKKAPATFNAGALFQT